jgi:hypothetical protein
MPDCEQNIIGVDPIQNIIAEVDAIQIVEIDQIVVNNAE